LKTTDIADTESALRRSVQRLTSSMHPEGYYEGVSDAGVAFDAANVVLARFVGDEWPEDVERIAGKMRHLLSGQDASGLFYLYPRGPCSVQATRIVCLAIDCVLRANGESLPRELRDELTNANERARTAIASPVGPRSELALVFVLRLVLEALDDNAPVPPRPVPGPRLALLVPVMLLGLLPKFVWRRTDRILYPFIAVFPQLLSLAGWRAVETSQAGAALDAALDRLPAFLRHAKARAGRGSVRWLLERQDSTGGFYYSSLFTFLFVPAVRNAADMGDSPALAERAAAAAARALDYVRERETAVSDGTMTSFLASDVWDTTAVATAFLESPPGTIAEPALEALGAYVIKQQSASGGFSFGRGSQYPDVDSTSLATGLFAALLTRNPAAPNRAAALVALTRAFDFLEKHRSAQGGFNAWTIRHGEVPPPMPSAITSFLFDVSSADVTARVMVTLSRVMDLVRADEGAARALGRVRLRRLEDLRQRGLAYLLSNVDRRTGLWHARWTLGFIIGTRFVFDALETYPGTVPSLDVLRTAAATTLLACQNPDGGFGESPESDTKGRFTPGPTSSALITAAAWGILSEATGARAAEGAARALQYLLRTQRADGTWPELSLCTQFPGLYASYELMTQVALTTTLFRVVRAQGSVARTVSKGNGAMRRQA
jgi:squalene-hopene/tetraprenyl-beta-curcumene cyclase